MINNDKPIWEGSAYEHTRWSKARIMPDMSVVLVDDSDPNDVELCAADEHDSLHVCHNAVRELVVELDKLRASRADLAGKLLEQGKAIDELRATVAAFERANHNQFVLIQELRDRITKLEAGVDNADNNDIFHWVKIMRGKGSG